MWVAYQELNSSLYETEVWVLHGYNIQRQTAGFTMCLELYVQELLAASSEMCKTSRVHSWMTSDAGFLENNHYLQFHLKYILLIWGFPFLRSISIHLNDETLVSQIETRSPWNSKTNPFPQRKPSRVLLKLLIINIFLFC